VLIDYLISKDGLRLEQVEISVSGLRLGRGGSGFVAETATEVTGTMRVLLVDLTAAIARPEVVDLLVAGVPGIARPEVTFANDPEGGIRIVGSVEAMGRRIPITAHTRVRISDNRMIVSPMQIRGLPLIGLLPVQLPDLELPLGLPLGLRFTEVTTEPGCLVLHFEGHDVRFQERAGGEDGTSTERRAGPPERDEPEAV
jgi:LmeA-like phospholipid-binding